MRDDLEACLRYHCLRLLEACLRCHCLVLCSFLWEMRDDLEACLRYHCSLEGRGMGNEHERGEGHEEHVCEKHERDQEHERGEGEGSEGQY